MTDRQLDDGDRKLLADCPLDITTSKTRKPTRDQAVLMMRIKRLWSAGLIGGNVVRNDAFGTCLRVTLRDPGRVAIGRAPLGIAR